LFVCCAVREAPFTLAPHGINDERNAGDEAIRIEISTTGSEHATHRCLTFEVTGDRRPQAGGDREAQLLGRPVDRMVGRQRADLSLTVH